MYSNTNVGHFLRRSVLSIQSTSLKSLRVQLGTNKTPDIAGAGFSCNMLKAPKENAHCTARINYYQGCHSLVTAVFKDFSRTVLRHFKSSSVQ